MTARFPFLLKGMATPQRLRWLFTDHPIYFITACSYNRRPILVLRFINSFTIADGACEARSRSDEEAMLIHRRRIATTRSPATPIGQLPPPSTNLSLNLGSVLVSTEFGLATR